MSNQANGVCCMKGCTFKSDVLIAQYQANAPYKVMVKVGAAWHEVMELEQDDPRITTLSEGGYLETMLFSPEDLPKILASDMEPESESDRVLN